ncbi:hypothetical protein EPUL_005582 [Erysiphe pulchra]|uniref:Integrase catalytic domain-containing protein n=1 Tax=Erysiphe pulchra TaxID=225359 RepID=A0A2S4PM81_9PEZI|nr:hypothetical protein EPUL_005582 [Erysiphe pulchra]
MTQNRTFLNHCAIGKKGSGPRYLDMFPLEVFRNVSELNYTNSVWFKDIYKYLDEGILPKDLGILEAAAFKRKCSRYQLGKGLQPSSYYILNGVSKKCIPESNVSEGLYKAYDLGGHFLSRILLKILKGIYWPGMAKDAVDYCLGCLQCVNFGFATRSQKLSLVKIAAPMDCFSIDFIGPFPPSMLENFNCSHILLVIDYFSRYIWAFPCKGDTGAEVVRCLPSIFGKFGVPVGLYSDPGAHFRKANKDYVVGAGAVWVTSPVAAKKATGMIEKAVQIIQQVLGKTLDEDRGQWAPLVERAELEVNRQSIEHLGFSPCEIFLGFQPALELETEYPSYHREALQAVMNTDLAFQYDTEEEEDCIIRFISNREDILRYVHVRSDKAKLRTKERHDLGVLEKRFHPG